MADNILEMRGITKEFPGVKALDDVNFVVKRGSIHALVGENGAGKSTLMNVLSGLYPYGSYSGDIVYEGEVCKFSNIKDSESKGIVIIHQELALVPYMSIGENMFLGNEQGKKYAIDWDKTHAEATKYLKIVGLTESSKTLIKDIGVGKQQMVEIAKALAKHARLMILDEPTSSLNEADSQALLDLLLEFKKQGMTSIIISHKINEVSYVADDITVLRDGKTIETLTKGVDDFSEDRIIRGMVGRELEDRFPKRSGVKIGDVALEVKHWNVFHPIYTEKKVINDVSFYVRKGEVVGFSGLMGAGRTELAMSIFGRSYVTEISGTVEIHGKEVKLHSPRQAIEAGLAYVTEDRKGNGLSRVGLRYRGPEGQRPDPVQPHFHQHDPGKPQGRHEERRDRQGQGAVGRGGIPGQAPHQDAHRTAERRQPLRRQPAEGAAGQVDVRRSGHSDPGRAYPRHRRRREVRDLLHHQRSGGGRQIRDHDLLGAARGPGYVRQDLRAQRGARRG